MLRRRTWLVPFVVGAVVTAVLFFVRLAFVAARRDRTRAGEESAVGSDTDVAPDDVLEVVGEDARVAIGRANAAYLESLRMADVARYAETFLDDAIAVPARGPIVRGRTAIERAMAATFAGFTFVEAEMSTVDLRLSGETAIETGHYRYCVVASSDGSPRTLVGRYAIVWKRHDRGWRIALDSAQPGVLDA